MMGRLSKRVPAVLSTGGAVAFLLFLLFAFSHLFRPDLQEEAVARHSLEAVEEALDLRNPTFPKDDPPQVQVPVDYSLGQDAAWYPQGESPLLTELVQEGRLPPVAERVGSEPMVMQGPEGIGRYGGSWFRSMPGASDLGVAGNRMAGATLVRWSPMGYPIVPALAKDWEVNDDATEYVFHLRKGIRWSDGHPFSSEDILYRFEKEILEAGFFSDRFMRVNGQLGEMEAPDDHTVIVRFPEPNHLFLEKLAIEHGIASPAHYFSRYFPPDGDPEVIAEAMAVHGQPSPRALYYYLHWVGNPERPRMAPWISRTEFLQPPYSFVRNPYYWAVDTEGNQLPYVDQVLYEVRDLRLLPIAAIGGGVHMQTRYVRFEDYTLLMEGRDDGDYRLLHWYPATRSLWTLFPNLNRRAPEGDKEARMKRELLRDKRFRQALSLAIERQPIIEAEFSGIGEPAQLAPGRDSFFHHEGALKAFTEFDLERANELLDELGLTGRDAEGYRTFSDGSRMTWIIDFTQFTGPGAVELVVSDWAAAGIRARAKERNRSLFFLIKNGFQADFLVWSGESEFHPMVQPRSFVPTSQTTFQATGYGQWFLAGGLRGDPEAEPFPAPEPGGDIERAMQLLVEAMQRPTQAGQREVFERIFDLNAENVWSISIASPPPALVIVSNAFRNVPAVALVGWNYATPANTGIETYFFRESNNSPQIDTKIKQQLTGELIPNYTAAGIVGGGSGGSSGGGLTGKLIAGMLWGVLIVAILLVALRHPFIARRILWAIPTLLIISVIVFSIIQLPPGSYLETLIIQKQMSGDEAQVEEIEQLRQMFHLDESVFQQYARWMGLNWFFSFKGEDRGLLQGNLGRSMQSQQSVNEEVGDRLILTVAISAATILFTWLVALPIGIYSAVRQYSLGDYFFTLVGFIGLSVPNFLLALLLMFVSQEWFGVAATGLFSPEFAAQPGWSWAKFVDLLKHIWVPVVVLGTAGTAGMIRIMRANLLDELQKPYVTTARAKGVRPMKLLLKYPVRIALNPFVSGIGGIFPALISGGSIVAIVLSLPTVGPLLLQALLSEDMYLAGSMLMVFSSLTVLGVLVSDLLLLALDPRIRMEGASR